MGILAQSTLHEPDSRIGPIAAILGVDFLYVGTYLHPMSADPNVPLAAFAEYAADHHWVASHLMQLLGVLLMAAALVRLSRKMANGPAADWAVLGMIGAVASMAVASALQAVDGVALRVHLRERIGTLDDAEQSEQVRQRVLQRRVELIKCGTNLLATCSRLLFVHSWRYSGR